MMYKKPTVFTCSKNMRSKKTLMKPMANLTGYPRIPPQSPVFQQSSTNFTKNKTKQKTVKRGQG